MTSTLGMFSKQMKCLAETLAKRFPENKEIKLAYTGISQLMAMNKKKLLDYFMQYAYKYKEQVEKKDEKFLLDYDYSEFNGAVVDDGSSYDIINTLKKHWGELEEEEKEAIWKYLQVLMILSEKYTNEKKH